MSERMWLNLLLLMLGAGATGCATSSLACRDCGETANWQHAESPHTSGTATCEQCQACNCQTAGFPQKSCRQGECRHADCRRANDFCPDAIPVNPGTYVNNWNSAMRCAAKSDEFLVSRNAWFNGGTELGPEATRNVQHLASRIATQSHDLLLEQEPVLPTYQETLAAATTRTQQLNTARRSAVVAALRSGGVVDAEQRVHATSPPPVGVRGIEAPRVFQQLFQGGNRGGQGGQNAGGGRGGMGGGGGGGGGRGRGRGF